MHQYIAYLAWLFLDCFCGWIDDGAASANSEMPAYYRCNERIHNRNRWVVVSKSKIHIAEIYQSNTNMTQHNVVPVSTLSSNICIIVHHHLPPSPNQNDPQETPMQSYSHPSTATYVPPSE